jgi:hypothetical protein
MLANEEEGIMSGVGMGEGFDGWVGGTTRWEWGGGSEK